MLRLLALGLLLWLPLPAVHAQSAGKIDFIQGDVRIVDGSAQGRQAKVGGEVREGDNLATGKDGEVHLKMSDGSVMALRPEARMAIVNFRNRGRKDDVSVISLFQGALRAITGWIGRRAPDQVRIQTPTATIGIRGTDHEAMVIPEGSDLGAAGTYDKVNAGGTQLRGERGSVDIAPGQAGFAAPGGSPTVLKSVPAFFAPTANEKRLDGLHDVIQRSPEPRPLLPPPPPQPPKSGASGQGSKGSNVQIQGNTNINAVGINSNAVAIGQGNEASNRIGTIGGK